MQTNQTHALRRQAEDILCRLGVYHPARNAYQRFLNREYYTTRVHDRAFFRDFVPEGGLVFDIGANEGRMTQTFAEIGASVVAVEPNPALAERVKARYGSSKVTVEATALGDADGVATLRLGRDSGHSSLSQDWQEAAGDAADRWDGSVEVPVTTLDALIARHGAPDFVKIDVEGFEPQVLRGAAETVRRCRPILYVENDRPQNQQEVLELIEGLGYRMYWHLPPLYEPENFRRSKENVFAKTVSVNVLALPNERPSNISGKPIDPKNWTDPLKRPLAPR